jgi:hypothetical protein
MLAAGLLLAAVSIAQAQQPDATAAGFAAAWATENTDALRELFADRVRLTIDDRTRTGVRPEQAVAALRPLLEDFVGPTPLVIRAEPNEPDGESGFAELRWDARFRDSGTPRLHTFIVTFVRRDDGWRISDLRILH